MLLVTDSFLSIESSGMSSKLPILGHVVPDGTSWQSREKSFEALCVDVDDDVDDDATSDAIPCIIKMGP